MLDDILDSLRLEWRPLVQLVGGPLDGSVDSISGEDVIKTDAAVWGYYRRTDRVACDGMPIFEWVSWSESDASKPMGMGDGG